MAVTGVATADYNTVSASLEGAETEHRVNSAGAGNSYDLYVSRVVESVVSRKVSACVRTPVTAKSNYQGLIFFYLHIASTSAMICALAKPLRSIAPDGQATVQAPQP